MKKVLNVFGIILSVLFSLLLIPLLILNPIWGGLSNLLQPAVIEEVTTQLVEEVDLSEIAQSNPELLLMLQEGGISPEAAQALLSSQVAQDILSIVSKDLAQVVQGSFTTSALTEAEILRLAGENQAELVQLARILRPTETSVMTDDQLTQFIDALVQENVLPMLGEVDQLMLDLQFQLHTEFAVALELATGPLVKTVLLAAVAVLAVLIFLCRWPHQEGLLWLGIDAALAALPVLGVALSLKGPQLSRLLAQGTGVPDVFGPILHQAGNTILIGAAALVAAAAVLIAGFVLLRDRRLKKQTAQHSDYAPAEPTPVKTVSAENAERSPWDNV